MRLPLTVLGALLLAACAVGPDYERPVLALPAAYGAAAAPATDTPADMPASAPASARQSWWEDLGDPDLPGLVARATAGGNPDLEAALARVAQARADLAGTGAAALPSLDASGKVSRDALSRNGEEFANFPFANVRTQFTDYRAGFDASWEIDLFGHTRRAVQAGQARLQGAQWAAQDLRLTVTAEVARATIELRVSARRLALAQEDLASLRATRELVALQRQAGRAGEPELRRASADAAAQEAVVAALQAERGANANALALVVGVTPTELQGLLHAQAPIPAAAHATVPPGTPSELLQRRPDIRQAERELAAATATVGVATANLYPRFSLVGDAGLESIRPGALLQEASRTWSAGPALTLPLFHGGALQAQVAQSEAARQAALASYRKAVLAGVGDVETALLRFGSEQARRQALEQAWRDARESLRVTRAQEAAGRASHLEVLAATRQASAAEQQLALASGSVATQFVALNKALGGGWAANAQEWSPPGDTGER